MNKSKKFKITTSEMEVVLARHFNYRQNIIVPNISWGANINHECDLFVVSAGVLFQTKKY